MTTDDRNVNGGLGRFFAHGDLRLVILHLIAEKPRHGYEIIKAIEEQVAGAYSPSPGVIYPTLTLLEELGYVTVSRATVRRSCMRLPRRAGLSSTPTAVRWTPSSPAWPRPAARTAADPRRRSACDGEHEARAATAPFARSAQRRANQRRGCGDRRAATSVERT
jgi:hypothetical protein